MPIQYVGGKVASLDTVTSPKAVSLTDLTGGLASAPSAGDVVIVGFNVATSGDISPAIDTGGYTTIADLFSDDNFDTNLLAALKVMGGSPDTSVTVSGGTANSGAVIAIEVWRGVDVANPQDVAATTATGGNTGRPDPPAITPTTTGAVVVVIGAGAWTSNSEAVFTQPGSELSNFLSASEGTDGTSSFRTATIGIGSYAWSSGSFNPVAWTGGNTATSASWAAVTLALRPTTSVTYDETLSEAITLADVRAASVLFGVGLSESATLADAANATALFNAARSEGVSLLESGVAGFSIYKVLSESLTLADNPVAGMIMPMSVSEGISLTDTPSAMMTARPVRSEAIALADSIGTSVQFIDILTEITLLGDLTAVTGALSAELVEQVYLLDGLLVMVTEPNGWIVPGDVSGSWIEAGGSSGGWTQVITADVDWTEK